MYLDVSWDDTGLNCHAVPPFNKQIFWLNISKIYGIFFPYGDAGGNIV